MELVVQAARSTSAKSRGFPWAFIDINNGSAFVNHSVDTQYGPTHWAPYAVTPAQAVDLGAVADVLRELLTERQHRTDGSLMELAERCRHLSGGDRDCIALRGTLITELEAQAVDLGQLPRYEPVGSDGMNMERIADGRWVKLDDVRALIGRQAVQS